MHYMRGGGLGRELGMGAVSELCFVARALPCWGWGAGDEEDGGQRTVTVTVGVGSVGWGGGRREEGRGGTCVVQHGVTSSRRAYGDTRDVERVSGEGVARVEPSPAPGRVNEPSPLLPPPPRLHCPSSLPSAWV